VYELDLNRIEARLIRGNAQLTELRDKTAECRVEVKSEYLERIRNLEKIKRAFEKKHRLLQIVSESTF
jgi:hypothetical protein